MACSARCIARWAASRPVSYTHLDVYKRQAATLLVAQFLEVPNLVGVFADTGNEHPETYEYVEYLKDAIGVPIITVRADFSEPVSYTHLPALRSPSPNGSLERRAKPYHLSLIHI